MGILPVERAIVIPDGRHPGLQYSVPSYSPDNNIALPATPLEIMQTRTRLFIQSKVWHHHNSVLADPGWPIQKIKKEINNHEKN